MGSSQEIVDYIMKISNIINEEINRYLNEEILGEKKSERSKGSHKKSDDGIRHGAIKREVVVEETLMPNLIVKPILT